MVLLVAYSAWVYPFEEAFLNSSSYKPLYLADNVVDLFFAIDIILTFFVAYIDPRSQLLVHDSKMIAIRLVLRRLVQFQLHILNLQMILKTVLQNVREVYENICEIGF